MIENEHSSNRNQDLGLTRRQFILSTLLTAAGPLATADSKALRAVNKKLTFVDTTLTVANSKSRASGKLLGLTTLDASGAERSELFTLDLDTGEVNFQVLPDYCFGHSLERISGNRWLSVPYGDDKMGCLILDQAGRPLDQLRTRNGYGFGGHAVVFDQGKKVFLHYNQTDRGAKGHGIAEIVNLISGKVERTIDTSIIHGHDMLLSARQQIVVSDDGVIDSVNPDDPYTLEAVKPALHFFSADLSLDRTIPLPINGSLVHIAEDQQQNISGAVEQYVRRNGAGLDALIQEFGSEDAAANYIKGFDPEVFPEDVPLPARLVTTGLNGEVEIGVGMDSIMLEPFDMAFNKKSQVTCCIFTESNSLAFRRPTGGWQHLSLAPAGLNLPFGVTNIGDTAQIAINGFERGIAIIDTSRMSLVRMHDVPTRGVKHLSANAFS